MKHEHDIEVCICGAIPMIRSEVNECNCKAWMECLSCGRKSPQHYDQPNEVHRCRDIVSGFQWEMFLHRERNSVKHPPG